MIYFPLIMALLFVGPALSAIAIRRSLPIRWQLGLLSICIFYGIFPLLLAWGGLSLAERFAFIVLPPVGLEKSLHGWSLPTGLQLLLSHRLVWVL
jgi:hypothetical protein